MTSQSQNSYLPDIPEILQDFLVVSTPDNDFVPKTKQNLSKLKKNFKNASIIEKTKQFIYNPTSKTYVEDNKKNRKSILKAFPNRNIKSKTKTFIKASSPKIKPIPLNPKNKIQVQRKYKGNTIKTTTKKVGILNPYTKRVIMDNKKNRDRIKNRYDKEIVNTFIQDIRKVRKNNLASKKRRTQKIKLNQARNIQRFIKAIAILKSKGEIKENLFVKVNGFGFTLTRENIETIQNNYNDFIQSITEDEDNEYDFSGAKYLSQIIQNNPDEIEIEFYRPGTTVYGGFFKYTHKIYNFDLSRYGIFETVNSENYVNNCLIQACIYSNKLSEEHIYKLKNITKNAFITQNQLKLISKEIGIGFSIKRRQNDNDSRTRIVRINPESEIVIELGLVDNHYFLIEQVPITKFAILNYPEIHNLFEFNRIYAKEGNKYKKSNNRFIDSFDVVNLLINNKENLLEIINYDKEIMKTPYYKKTQEIVSLGFSRKSDVRPIVFKEKKAIDENTLIINADFETTTEGECHKPFLLCYKIVGKPEVVSIFKTDSTALALEFLNKVVEAVKKEEKDKVIIYFHNLGYDVRFLIPYMYGFNYIEKSATKVILCSGFYKKVKIVFNCSLAMTNTALGDFNESFKLGEQKKEILPYGLYTQQNINKMLVPVKDAVRILRKEGKTEEDVNYFLNKVKELKLLENNGKDFNHIKYSEFYCKEDVLTQEKGFNQFRENIFQICEEYGKINNINTAKLDVHNYLTLASLGDSLIKSWGAYEGCFEISGTPRAFIQKCVVGGRCMTKENKKIKVVQEKNLSALQRKLKTHQDKSGQYKLELDANKQKIYIYYLKNDGTLSDFDAVSLYPSAMKRLGFLKGTPKILSKNQLNYEFLSKQDGYFVKINITRIGKHYDFPLISKKNDKGIREFDNNNLGIHYVDNIALQDYIDFQDIEFEVLQGYYFNEGLNYNIQNIIEFLFSQRLQMKKIGNPIQNVYKLLMNSCYGKTCLKEIDTEVSIMSKDKFERYLINNFNFIKMQTDIHNSELVKVKSIKAVSNHFNACHIGSHILSMSKRIMNEVMTTAEDIGINIFYQDTDSMHIETDKIDLLAKEFKKKYNRDLIGKNMGCFHSDFEQIKREDGTKINKEPVAVESIFLGKKSYIDKLEVVMDNKTYNAIHKRLKGIPHKTIEAESRERFNGDDLQIYESLLAGNTIKFDLLKGGVKFEGKADFTIKNKDIFTRDVKF